MFRWSFRVLESIEHRSPRAVKYVSSEPPKATVLSYPAILIDTEPLLEQAIEKISKSTYFSVDLEAFCKQTVDQKTLGKLSLLQFCSREAEAVHLVDILTLGIPQVVKHIKPLMINEKIQKIFFDCRRDVEALSCQMQIKPRGAIDLQLFYSATQWCSKSVNRRSGMGYVLKAVTGQTRQEGDSAVQAAMTLGNRPVWDVRPLPSHFIEYAADDVRNTLLLAEALFKQHPERIEAVQRLTAQYVDHYAVERAVEVEADPQPNEVSVEWLERFFGPGGKCNYCSQKGHTEAECFKKNKNAVKCTHCGETGHIASNCYKRFPHLLKCEHCGQMGHTSAKCFSKNPCQHCGGHHSSENCLKLKKSSQPFQRDVLPREVVPKKVPKTEPPKPPVWGTE